MASRAALLGCLLPRAAFFGQLRQTAASASTTTTRAFSAESYRRTMTASRPTQTTQAHPPFLPQTMRRTYHPQRPHPLAQQQQQQQSQPPFSPQPYPVQESFLPPPPPPPRWRRFRTSSGVFFLIGVSAWFFYLWPLAADYFDASDDGPLLQPHEIRHSPEEREAIRELLAESEHIPLVQAMQADPDWEEWNLGTKWEGTGDDTVPELLPSSPSMPSPRTRYTTGALGGMRGMGGFHRIFRNTVTGEVTSLVLLGPALAGWPSVVHGGALATVLDEALGRCAIQTLPARTGVTARLELQYRKPVSVGQIYVVKCKPDIRPADALQSAGSSAELRKLWCTATLEDLEGAKYVQARALFVVPQKYKLARVEDRF